VSEPSASLTPQQQARLAEALRSLLPEEDRRAAEAAAKVEAWRQRYWDQPAAWARDNLRWPTGAHLTSYQAEILDEVPRRKRMAVASCRGAGKTALAAILCLWFATTRDGTGGTDWKAVLTAGGYRQLIEYLLPECMKFARLIRWERIGRPPWQPGAQLLKTGIEGETGSMFPAVSHTSSLIEGAHASQVLYIFDESRSIPEDTWEAVEGVFSNAGTLGRDAMMLAISTPGLREGRFWAIHQNKDGAFDHWTRRHVKINEAIQEQMVSPAWVEQRARAWGVESALYRSQVLGEFSSLDEAGVIPGPWVEEAMQRGLEREPERFEVEVAADRTRGAEDGI
jgi:hypothetical protein